MGGYGSGRLGARPVAEQSLAWCIGDMREAIGAVLKEGSGSRWTGSIRWRRALIGEVTSCGYMVVHGNSGQLVVLLSYTVDGGEPILDRVPLVPTPCHFGGVRWWFSCTGCGQRVGTLFNPGHHWRCRRCWNITYSSSNDSHKYDRLFRSMGYDPRVSKLLFRRRR